MMEEIEAKLREQARNSQPEELKKLFSQYRNLDVNAANEVSVLLRYLILSKFFFNYFFLL